MEPLKAYTYTREECGMPTEWTHPPFALPLCEPTTDPKTADVFVVPWEIWQLERAGMLETVWGKLPHLRGNEGRHVVFSCGENTWVRPELPAIWIRCDATRFTCTLNPTTVPWPWPVADFGELAAAPDSDITVDVGFQGWVSNPLVSDCISAVGRTKGINAVIRPDKRFYGYVERDNAKEAAELTASYRALLWRSRMWLCPVSRPDGVHRYRFYEAMSAGRIAVLLGDGAVFPFGDRIDYAAFTFQVPEFQVWDTGELCKKFLAETPRQELAERGQIGRKAWERWLDRRRWPEILDSVVREGLAKCR